MAGVAANNVGSIINNTTNWADSLLNAANSALSDLGSIELSPSYPYYISAVELPDISKYLSEGSRPSGISIGSSPEVVSITSPITKPTPPTYSMPTLGDMKDIILPNLPSLTIPSIDIAPPVYNIASPKEWSFNLDNVLISDDPLVMECISKLINNIRYGGTGLSESVENDIWNRDLERNEQTLQDSTDKMVQLWAKTGFSLPDGMLAHSIAELQKEYANRRIDRSREIAIKQADLEQANLFKSLELSISLFSRVIELLIRYESLVLESQEKTARYANEYIDLQIKTYAAMVEAYKAKAMTYEMTIRAELSKVEIYRAQIEGQKLIGDINEQTVKIYSERMSAISVMVDTYKTEIQAMTAEMEMEKTKIEANKLQFDAWAKAADVAMAKYNGEVEMYKAVSQVNIAKAEVLGGQAEAEAKINLGYVELKVKSLEANNREMDLKAQISMEAMKGVAQAYSSMAAGAMAAINANASMSYGETAQVEV